MKERSRYIDISKGVAICLVIIGHTIQMASGNEYRVKEMFYDNLLFKFIYSFHMPLFMLVSGFLFYNTVSRYSIRKVAILRVKSTLIPIWSWTLLVESLKLVILLFENKGQISANEVIRDFILSGVNSLWFLWAVFYASFGVIIVRKMCNDKLFIHIMVLAVMLFIPDRLNLYLYKFVYPYFIAGYYWNKKEMQKRVNNINRIVYSLLASTVLYVVLFMNYSKDVYIYTSFVSILNSTNVLEQLKIDLLRWVIGFAGSIMVLSLINLLYSSANRLKKSKCVKVISEFGRSSAGIYIISNYVYALIIPKIASEWSYSFIHTMFFSSIITIICYVVVQIISRCRRLNLILFGGR